MSFSFKKDDSCFNIVFYYFNGMIFYYLVFRNVVENNLLKIIESILT